VKRAEHSKGYQNAKRKLGGVTTHFSEIIELKFGKNAIHSLYFLKSFFRIMVAHFSLKNAWLSTFFFLDSYNPC